jgi:creatinine amidohydrolase/Fe(II)-dependent formamide hydrolase-like protein
LEKAVANPNPHSANMHKLVARGMISKITHSNDRGYLGESANYGDPKLADKQKGEKIINVAVETGITLLEELKLHARGCSIETVSEYRVRAREKKDE